MGSGKGLCKVLCNGEVKGSNKGSGKGSCNSVDSSLCKGWGKCLGMVWEKVQVRF